MFNDISRAYMYARTASDVYVELCEEDKTESRCEHRCGKLVKSMYGTRVAARDWQADVTRTMQGPGISVGQSISVRVLGSAKRHEGAGTRGRLL